MLSTQAAITPHVKAAAQVVYKPDRVDMAVANEQYPLCRVQPTELIPVLVKAMQELKAVNDALREDFDAYKAAHP